MADFQLSKMKINVLAQKVEGNYYLKARSPANGSVIGMSTKYTVQTKGGPIVITDNVKIASTCL